MNNAVNDVILIQEVFMGLLDIKSQAAVDVISHAINHQNFGTLIENILVSVKCYPLNVNEIASRVKSIFSDLKTIQLKIKFSALLLKETFETICRCSFGVKVTYISFVYYLTKYQVFMLENVFLKITKLWNTHDEYHPFMWVFFIWFSPEFNDTIPIMMKQMSTSERIEINSTVLKNLFTTFQKFSERSNINWLNFDIYRENGKLDSPLLTMIRKDDFNGLLDYYCKESFDPNSKIEAPLFGTCKYLLLHPTLIQVACLYGSVNCTRFLLTIGADPTIFDDKRNSTAKYAIIGRNNEIIRIILQSGVDFNNLSYFAATYHRHELFSWLYEYIDNMDSIDPKGFTIPYSMIKSNNFAGILKLIDNNDLVEQTDDFTFIHRAAEKGRTQMLDYFLKLKNYNINIVDSQERTPLHMAAMKGKASTLKYLLKINSINIDKIDNTGKTAFYYASKSSYKCVKALVEIKDLNFNTFDVNLTSPLIVASKSNITKTVKLLLSIPNISINHLDNRTWSALHYAALKGNQKIAKMIIEHPMTNKMICTNTGRTALDISLQFAQMPIVKMFLDYGMVQKVSIT